MFKNTYRVTVAPFEKALPHPQALCGTGTFSTTEQDLLRTLWILIAVLIGTTVLGAFTRGFDDDEFQFMILAVNIAEGKRLYADVWDNHGPLLTTLIAHIYETMGWKSHSVMFLGRLTILCCLPITLWFAYRLAKEALRSSPLLPPLTLFVLLISALFAKVSVQIRVDNPLFAVWAATLFFWLRGWNTGRTALFWYAGLILGCGFWFSFKTMVLGATVAVLFAAGMLLKRRWMWGPLLAFGAGTTVAPLFMAALLTRSEILEPFWNAYVLQNTDRAHESPLLALAVFFMWDLLAAPIFFATLYAASRRALARKLPENFLLILAASLALTLQYVFVLPTHYEQSIIPLILTASPLMAWAILEYTPHLQLDRFALVRKLWPEGPNVRALVAALLLVTTAFHWWPIPWSWVQIRQADQIMERIEPGATVLDGVGIPLFRPRAVPYLSWVSTLRHRLQHDALGIDLSAELDRHDVRYVVMDYRIRDMGPEVEAFLREHYQPAGFGELWVAGRSVTKGTQRTRGTEETEVDGEESELPIRIAGVYEWKVTSGDTALILDGRPASNPVALADGIHHARWEGRGDLILSAISLTR